MPHQHSARALCLLLLPALLLQAASMAQAEPASPGGAPAVSAPAAPAPAEPLSPAPTTAAPTTPAPSSSAPGSPAATTPAATTPAATPPVATPPSPGGSPPSPASGKPSPAQQAVLERIRRMRDGDQRRFGSCSYRWDRWKLHADGTRTTSYSCEGTPIVDRTIGVNCSKLQINSFDPLPKANDKGETWAWGTWRLPKAGGEEQMVATLCANALPAPPAVPTGADGAAAPGRPVAPRTGTPRATSP